MAKLVPLYSGSSGNSTFIGTGGRGILVDVGKSCKMTLAALAASGVDEKGVEAIFITHEHIDHIRGLDVLSRKLDVPLYCSAGTAEYLRRTGAVKDFIELHIIDDAVEVAGLRVSPFRASHDSADCLGFRIEFENGKTAAVATDLGFVSEEVLSSITGCSVVMLESNYDRHMLDVGSYPYYLKQRIKGDRGHLSNDDCAETLRLLARAGGKRFVLAHLSRENNMPELARVTANAALMDEGLNEKTDYLLVTARRDEPTLAVIF